MTTDRREDDMVVEGLRAAFRPPEAEADERLHTRLAERADVDGLLDIAYRTIDSPIGELLLAATPEGLVRVAFDREDRDVVLTELAARISGRILHAPRRLDAAARQLEEYFEGRRSTFEVPLDLQLAHGFRRTVLAHLCTIEYGATESYAQVAAATGHPAAVRAVGGACSHNPVPLVVPCHRVVRSDGTIGQYGGGVEVKHALLAMESPVLSFQFGPIGQDLKDTTTGRHR